MSEKTEDQVIECQNCGSKWRVSLDLDIGRVIAKLEECPLCEKKEAA